MMIDEPREMKAKDQGVSWRPNISSGRDGAARDGRPYKGPRCFREVSTLLLRGTTMETIQPSNIRTFQPARAQTSAWLFSRDIDLLVFLGSAAVALLLIPVGMRAAVLYGDTPDWTWVPAVLLIDV